MAATESRFRVMASDAQVIVVDGPPDALQVAQRALTELEQAWSRFVPGSDIDRLNSTPGLPVAVDGATITLVETMVEAWRVTAGRLDATVLPALLEAGYHTSIENDAAVTALPIGFRPATAGLQDVEIGPDSGTITLPPGTVIDPGGIGKGLAADLVVAELLARGAAGALVSVGGDLAAAGTPPSSFGWTVAIEDPFDPRTPLGSIAISGGGVATSSTRSRRWTRGHTACHHVIDPATGAPSHTDLAAATVIAACGWQAEAHATGAILAGASGFFDYVDDHRVEAVAITSTGATLATGRVAPLLETVVPA